MKPSMFQPSRLIAAVLLSLLLAACSEKAPVDHQKAALDAIRKGDLASAQIQLKSAIQTAPQAGELRYLLGAVLLDLGDPAGAMLELRRASEFGRSDDSLTAKLARALVAMGRYKESIETYGNVTPTDPAARAELSSAMAEAWLSQRAIDKAKSASAEALAAVPDFGPALLMKARIAAAENDLDQALTLAARAAASGPRAGDAHLVRAVLLARAKGDRAAAIAALNEAAKHPATLLMARWGLIEAYIQNKDLPKAKEQLGLLQRSHPTSLNTAYLTAVIAHVEGDYAKALSLTDALLKHAPSSQPVLMLAGATHLRLGQLVAAEAKLGRVVQTAERAPAARKLLAETYLRMGQPDKVLATLKPILEGQTDADALAMAGQAHLQKGAGREAQDAYSAAAKLRPDDIRIRTSSALTNLFTGRSEAAFGALEQLAAGDAGQTADLALISAYLQRQEFDRALAAIARLEKKQPDGPLPRHLRGVSLLGKGDTPSARKAFESALAADPGYFASTNMLAKLDAADKRFDAAQARLEAAVKLAPKNVAARMALIDVLRSRSSPPDQVEKAIDDAIRASPSEPGPYLAKLAHVARYRGTKEAAAQAQAALSAVPDHPELLDAAGQALSAAGDDQQALSVFGRMTALMPQSPLPYLRLADLQLKRGYRTEAASMLSRAFDVAPGSIEVHRRLLAHAVRTKEYKVVLAAARELQRRAPQSAAGFLLEGSAEASRKSWAAALAAYQGALNKADGNGQAERSYYSTLVQAGFASRAEEFARTWLRQHPQDVHLRGLLGSEALVAGRAADAERYFRQIVEVEPRSSAALNNLAWLLVDRRDPAALTFAERALAVSPNSAAVLDTMARALKADGQLARAIEFQKRAVEVGDGHPDYRLALARLLVAAGDKDGAARELDRLTALGEKFRGQKAVAALRLELAR